MRSMTGVKRRKRVDEEEQEHGDTVNDHAFASPYHSHVGAVHDLDDVTDRPCGLHRDLWSTAAGNSIRGELDHR